MTCFLSIDPGKEKIGLALFKEKEVIMHKIIKRDILMDFLKELKQKFNIEFAVLGKGTFSKILYKKLGEIFEKIILVDEYNTTQKAKFLYFKDNPPKGIFKYIPLTLLYPPVPFDDYAAIIIGLNYIKNGRK